MGTYHLGIIPLLKLYSEDTVNGRSDLLEAAVARLRKLDAVARGENRHGSVVIEIVYRDGIPQFYRENQPATYKAES